MVGLEEKAARPIGGTPARGTSGRTARRLGTRGRAIAAVILWTGLVPASVAFAQYDVSPPPILQWFESSYETIEDRTADLFMAGYGAVWLPPPGRADLSDYSVGYDVYDRFDLGRPGRPTLYGTETGLKTVAGSFHSAAIDLHVDAVINHNGFSDLGTPGFEAAGGYPGLALTLPWDIDGDFNSAYDYGDLQMRLAGLIDINHGKNYPFIRHPVDAGDGRNIPTIGTAPDFAGRLANVPTASNRRFYPDRALEPIMVYDPATGEGDIAIYPFNLSDPMAGDPTEENATGYLMRYLQWMVQVIGVDGFRIDAAKHVEGFTFDFFDRAVYRQNPRLHLDGSTRHVFSYSEVFDGDRGYLQTFVKKTIDPGNPGVIGGNRDVLDFPLQFALRDNLTGNGLQNSWYNIRNAAMDFHADTMHNGSQGVMFAQSHDEWGPELSNVAHAYVLMHPGNAVVYLNGREFGENRDFPKLGRGDALGGVYGDYLPRLVAARNTHGRGNYCERWIEKELFAYERCGSAIVLLSNRTDAGYDSRTIQTSFAPGTPLVELTGAASDAGIDPRDDIPSLLVVNGDGTVNVRFLRNSSFDENMDAFYHRTGALIYGLAAPEAPAGLELEGTAGVLPGGTPEADDYSNGVTRLTDLYVVTGQTLRARLQTVPAYLLGFHRDVWADGDNALISIDDGVDVNGSGGVDYVAPGTVSYGFEEFATKREPLIGPGGLGDGGWDGDGEFVQDIDVTRLAEGRHYLEVRAFRHRTDGGPAIYSSFKKVIYVDRLPPVSAVDGFQPFDSAPDDANNQDLLVRSVDRTADAVHVFLDEPAAVTDDDFIARALAGQSPAGQIDRDLWAYGYFGLTHGNHTATVVTFEPTGNVNVQRFGGLFTRTGHGAGVGDVNFDGDLTPGDLVDVPDAFEELLWSDNAKFNPAADADGDGRIDARDLPPLKQALVDGGADAPTMATYGAVLSRRTDLNADGANDAGDHAHLRSRFGADDWKSDLNADGTVTPLDTFFLTAALGQLPEAATVRQAASGNWNDANQWTAGVPTGAAGAHVDGGREVTAGPGAVHAANVYVGLGESGRLALAGATLQAGALHVGPGGAVAGDANSEIELTGDLLSLSSRADVWDLSEATVRFAAAGTSDGVQWLEIAGRNVGTDAGGWEDNFAVGALVVDPGAYVRLTDSFANQGGDAREALYVDWLVFADPNEGEPPGRLDPGDLRVYYRNGGSPKELVAGDVGLDGDVDHLDYLAMKAHLGTPSDAGWAQGDTNADLRVDALDFRALEANFGRITLPSASPSVPEPTPFVFLVVFGFALVRRRVPS